MAVTRRDSLLAKRARGRGAAGPGLFLAALLAGMKTGEGETGDITLGG